MTRGITGGWRKLTNNINVKINKYEKGGHAAKLKSHIYAKYFNHKSEKNIPFENDWCRWKTILKRILTEVGGRDAD